MQSLLINEFNVFIEHQAECDMMTSFAEGPGIVSTSTDCIVYVKNALPVTNNAILFGLMS